MIYGNEIDSTEFGRVPAIYILYALNGLFRCTVLENNNECRMSNKTELLNAQHVPFTEMQMAIFHFIISIFLQ